MLKSEASAVPFPAHGTSPDREIAMSRTERLDRRPSICFISETSRIQRPLIDPSVRYRCYHPAEALSADGYGVTVTAAATFFAEPSFDYDIYVFHRPNVRHPAFDRTLDRLKSLGRTLIADYDDLIFGDADIASVSSIVKNGRKERDVAIAMFRDNAIALERFDRFSVSTQPLADRVREVRPGARIAVVPNELPDSTLRPHLAIGTAFRKRSPHVIGYFAGTKSHDADFPVVEKALLRVLSEDRRKSLLVVGPVRLPASIAALPNVRARDVVPYWYLPELMSACDTVIAPLEDTVFNRCKSRVKYLEAAISGCRLVATPIPDMSSVGASHITFARNDDEWYEGLSYLPSAESREALVRANVDFIARRDSVASLRAVGGF